MSWLYLRLIFSTENSQPTHKPQHRHNISQGIPFPMEIIRPFFPLFPVCKCDGSTSVRPQSWSAASASPFGTALQWLGSASFGTRCRTLAHTGHAALRGLLVPGRQRAVQAGRLLPANGGRQSGFKAQGWRANFTFTLPELTMNKKIDEFREMHRKMKRDAPYSRIWLFFKHMLQISLFHVECCQ